MFKLDKVICNVVSELVGEQVGTVAEMKDGSHLAELISLINQNFFKQDPSLNN